MGCDIHMYVEYRNPEDREDYWAPFGGRINPGRDYSLFGRLAGVRGGDAKIEPRGIPLNMAYVTAGDWWITVSDEYEGENVCTTEAAKGYAKYGSKLEEHDGKISRVENPDWHTPSWLTSKEFSLIMKEGEANDEYFALLAAMKELVRRKNEVRVVFWFDN